MPITLWRHMSVELWRLVLLSAIVLVSVIAFAAAVKPLADGLLSPVGALKFMGLASMPMLAYALPFAASFGTTLAYHRMAQDNEITAAQAGGLSHVKLLVPALVAGVVLASSLAVLNEQVIPRFLRGMERMVTLDVAQMLVTRIERGQPAQLGDLTVHADAVRRIAPDPSSGAIDQLLLVGAAAIETDAAGEVVTDATAERAWVVLLPGPLAGFEEGSLAAVIQLERGVGATRGELRAIDQVRTRPFRIPDAFEDDPKFLTFGELKELRREPERMGFINAMRVELARLLAAHEGIERVSQQVTRDGVLRLEGPAGMAAVVTASRIVPEKGYRLLPAEPGQPILVDLYRPGPDGTPGGGGVDRIEAESAVLELQANASVAGREFDVTAVSPGLVFTLALDGVRLTARSSVAGTADSVETEQSQRTITGLRLRSDPLDALLERSQAQLQAAAEALPAGVERYDDIRAFADRAQRMTDKLLREITSKQHERWAMAVNCLVMVLTGAVTALMLKNSPPLVVYLWSFFPAVLTIVLISSGQQATHSDGGVFSVALLWSGVVALGVYASVAAAAVSRR